jgi:hypothetical protein
MRKSLGEEQQLGFVVLPKLKIDGAMYDSTYPTAKSREEQQQMWAKLLFYHSKLRFQKEGWRHREVLLSHWLHWQNV